MPATNNSIGGASLTPGKMPKNMKRMTIAQVDNGFVISMQKVEEYGETQKVAKEIGEIADVINTYFTE